MAQLYALAIGIEPDGSVEQRYLMDGCAEAFPTFATVIAREAGLNAQTLDVDFAGVVLARLCLEWRSRVPVRGNAQVSSRLQALTDHGEKGAGIWTVTDIVAQDPICTIWQELRARYDGGRGAFGRVLDRQVPAQPATQCEKIRIPLNLPHLFRHLGDRNPLHVDPRQAEKMGFPGPILHGQALFGLIARFVHRHDDGLVRLDVRFTAPVYPGSELAFWFARSAHGGTFRCLDGEQRSVAKGYWCSDKADRQAEVSAAGGGL